MRLPRYVRPVSTATPATSRRTGPYVFFRFDVMVPAPTLHHRPSTEFPTNPSCDLLLYPSMTAVAISPRTTHQGPIADARIGPPTMRVLAPAQSGPSSRAPDLTSTPLSSTTGPRVVSKTTPGSTAASRIASHAGSPMTIAAGGTGSDSPPPSSRSR